MKPMKLLSFGEIVWDIFGDERTLGGAPLNFAAHAALQGSDAWLLSAVGDDPLGEEARRRVKDLGVRIEGIFTDPLRESGVCTISLDEKGVPSYRLPEETAFDFIPLPHDLPTSFDALAFGSLSLRSEQNRGTLRTLLSQISFGEIYADLNVRLPYCSEEALCLCLSHATILKISEEELPYVTSLVLREELPSREAAPLLASRYPQLRLILITKGEEGSLCYVSTADRFYTCPASPTVAVSTVGAGDSFGATFLTQYFQTEDIPSCLRLASLVSAHVVASKDAVPLTTKEFLANIANQ